MQLVTVPIWLTAWGATKYGEWLILWAIPGYLTLCDLGFGDASGSAMTVEVAAGNREAALKIYHSSWALLALISAGASAILISGVWAVPWATLFHLTTLSSYQASVVLLLIGLYALLTQQNGMFESGYRCDGYFAEGVYFALILRVAETCAAAAAAVLTNSFIAVAGTYLFVRGVGTLAYGLELRRRSPWLTLSVRFADRETIRGMLKPAFGFIILPLGQALSYQGYSMIIATSLGPAAVTMFATLRTLSRTVLQISSALGRALWPEFSMAFGAKDLPLARKLYRHALQATIGLSSVCGAILWAAGPSIYSVWTHKQVHFDANCFHVLILVSIAASIWYASSVVAMSKNEHHGLATIFLTATTVSLAIAWLSVRYVGNLGAAISLLAVDLVMCWVTLDTALKHMGQGRMRFIGSLMRFNGRPEMAKLRTRSS